VSLRVPKGTAKGDYQLPVGQKGNGQMVGGVTLVAKVVK